MEAPRTRGQEVLARFVVALLIALVLAGLALYGFSEATRDRLWENIFERPGGPMTFRFILQPCMVMFAAVRAGIRDAKSGRPPYLWTLLSDPTQRGALLWDGVVSTARVLLLGIVMDVIYQWIVLGTFFPGEAAVVAVALAFIPYLILRGPIDRIVLWSMGATTPEAAH